MMQLPRPHSAIHREPMPLDIDRDTVGVRIGGYCFDGFRIDLGSFCITRDGEPIKIEPKAYEVLVYLIERRDRVVEKRELLDTIWADSFVTENALTRVVAQLRKALGGAATVPHIQTVHKRGYRFVAEVVVEAAAPAPVVSSSLAPVPLDSAKAVPARTARAGRIWGAAAVLALLVGAAAAVHSAAERPEPVDSIAVLPLVAVRGNSGSAELSDGIAAALSASLARQKGLKVASHASVFHGEHESSDPVAVGRELGVSTVFAGRYVERNGTLILKVELVDVGEGRQIWSGHYERPASDLVVVQEQISRDVFEALRLQVADSDARASA